MPSTTHKDFNSFGRDFLPGTLGVEIITVSAALVESRMKVEKRLLAPNGFLHAATVIALADTSCGYGCVAALPEGASGFTTIELKSNFLGTAREGDRLPRHSGAPRAHHARLGCDGGGGGLGGAHRPVPLHPDGPLAQKVDSGGRSCLNAPR